MVKKEDKKKEALINQESKDNSKKKCFFITPIGKDGSIEFKKMTALLDNVINPVLKGFDYDSVVAHEIQKIGSIGDQVFESIKDSSLVIANLTGLNPNVMYETAVAHSFAKPTIMIMERSDEERLPFDLLGDRAVFFDNTIEGTGNLIKELNKKIDHIQENTQVDNPVIRVMKKSATLQSIDGDDSISAQMYRMIVEIQEEMQMNRKSGNPIMYSSNLRETYTDQFVITFLEKNISHQALVDVTTRLINAVSEVKETSVVNGIITLKVTHTKKRPRFKIIQEIEEILKNETDFGDFQIVSISK